MHHLTVESSGTIGGPLVQSRPVDIPNEEQRQQSIQQVRGYLDQRQQAMTNGQPVLAAPSPIPDLLAVPPGPLAPGVFQPAAVQAPAALGAAAGAPSPVRSPSGPKEPIPGPSNASPVVPAPQGLTEDLPREGEPFVPQWLELKPASTHYKKSLGFLPFKTTVSKDDEKKIENVHELWYVRREFYPPDTPASKPPFAIPSAVVMYQGRLQVLVPVMVPVIENRSAEELAREFFTHTPTQVNPGEFLTDYTPPPGHNHSSEQVINGKFRW